MIGKSVRKIRKMRGITQRELALMINVKPNTLCQYELGKSEISLSILMKIASVLNCSVNDFIYADLPDGGDAGDNASTDDFSSRVAQSSNSSTDNKIIKAIQLLDEPHKNKVLEYIRDQLMVSDYLKINKRRI